MHPLLAAASWEAVEDADARFAALGRALEELGAERLEREAALLARSPIGDERQVGLDALAVLIQADERLVPLAVALTRGLHADPDEDTRWSAAHLLAGSGHPDAAGPLCAFAQDADGDVRWQVAYGLPEMIAAADGGPEVAVHTLIQLMQDADGDVRDWATFGLGVKTTVDGAQVRAALAARLQDPEGETAGEALVGLARRGDPRVPGLIEQRVEQGDVGNLVVSAAEAYAQPSCCTALRQLEREGWSDEAFPDLLERAIAACCPAPS
ncbi:HEAT repeat domain-containing protein [Motilibacter deserti]|uniref:HEAT repeat protein n=1 Tax=Motilibacter deserti TaxID=2714956 RepID=A0ABX0GV06_9ACTN|nr:HEAT repeat domain-containing protein [Motilibacter deserti]NHC13128.1 hypothetical protein [Motilibacter deserti]